MELDYCFSKTSEELRQILQLQQENLASAVSENEKVSDGFVTVAHDLHILQKMNDICPHAIVKDGPLVVGYALSMHPIFGSDIKVLEPMFTELQKLVSYEYKYLVMGQICISKQYRGKGIFRNLYRTMWNRYKDDFDCIITEVDVSNTRSLNAHHAIGFKDLHRYSSGGQDWYLIMLDGL